MEPFSKAQWEVSLWKCQDLPWSRQEDTGYNWGEIDWLIDFISIALSICWVHSLKKEMATHCNTGVAIHPIFLPGKFHGLRSLAGFSPRGHKVSDTTEWLSIHVHSLGLRSGTGGLFGVREKHSRVPFTHTQNSSDTSYSGFLLFFPQRIPAEEPINQFNSDPSCLELVSDSNKLRLSPMWLYPFRCQASARLSHALLIYWLYIRFPMTPSLD